MSARAAAPVLVRYHHDVSLRFQLDGGDPALDERHVLRVPRPSPLERGIDVCAGLDLRN